MASSSAGPAPPGALPETPSKLEQVTQTLANHVDKAHAHIKPLISDEDGNVHPWAMPSFAAAAIVFFGVLLCICRKPKVIKRAVLNYDVEGGNGTTGNVLPAAVLTAAAAADVTTLRQWIGDERCVIDASAADGSTALHVAAKHGHANVLRLLLDAGADALCADAELRTALHHVASAGHGLCVKALLDAGADPEGRDGEGKTPLQLAEAGRHMGCLRMMRLGLERRTQNDKTFRRAK